MIRGKNIYLRTVRESDLDFYYERVCDVEGNGYKFEGVARGAVFHRGAYRDMEVYSILRQEAPATLEEAFARIGKS